MRRVVSMLLVGCGAWAQQPAAKTPQKGDAPLTRSSFSASGLHNEKVLTDLFIGDFGNMYQTILMDANIYKGSKVGNIGDHAFQSCPCTDARGPRSPGRTRRH